LRKFPRILEELLYGFELVRSAAVRF